MFYKVNKVEPLEDFIIEITFENGIIKYYDVSKLVFVPRTSFDPVPNVDSAVIKLVKKEKAFLKNEELFFKIIKDSFHMKRKNIKNNLKAYDLEIIEKVLKCCTFYKGYGEIDSLVMELAEEIKQGYHIANIEMTPSMSIHEVNTEPDLIITLRKVGVL